MFQRIGFNNLGIVSAAALFAGAFACSSVACTASTASTGGSGGNGNASTTRSSSGGAGSSNRSTATRSSSVVPDAGNTADSGSDGSTPDAGNTSTPDGGRDGAAPVALDITFAGSTVPAGWSITNLPGSAIVVASQENHGGTDGTGAMQAMVPFTAANQQAWVEYSFPSPVDLTGKTISAWVLVTSAANPVDVQVLVEDQAGDSRAESTGSNVSASTNWQQVTFSVPSSITGQSWSATQISYFGISLSGTGSTNFGTATVYIDDVTVQ